MYEIIIQPFLTGLSVGVFCFTYCAPFVAPFIVAEKRETKKNFSLVLQFIGGRFLGYVLFGAIFGYLGEKISSATVNLILIIVMILMALLMIFYALGLMKPQLSFCSAKGFKTKLPVVLGFLMGINICPPFLMSLAYVFTLHSVFKGIIYFLMFFLGTSLYFLPLFFLGFLNKMKEFRWVARIAALIVGFSFFVYGIYYIIRGAVIFHLF